MAVRRGKFLLRIDLAEQTTAAASLRRSGHLVADVRRSLDAGRHLLPLANVRRGQYLLRVLLVGSGGARQLIIRPVRIR
jgi:hypothetical protein